jgi:hypothetical protein
MKKNEKKMKKQRYRIFFFYYFCTQYFFIFLHNSISLNNFYEKFILSFTGDNHVCIMPET